MDVTAEKSVFVLEAAPNKRRYVSWLLASLAMFFLIFYQIPGESQDWQSYKQFFDALRSEGIAALHTSRFEPGFVIVSLLLTDALSSNLTVYGLIAAFAMFLKCGVINQFSPNKLTFIVALFFYMVRFGPLHEMTQIRVACSAAFLFLAFMFVWRDNRPAAILSCLAALAFHMTAIVIVPPLLLMRSCNRLTVIMTSVAVFAATLFGVELVMGYFRDTVHVVKMYEAAGFGDQTPNEVSVALLLDWGMVITGLTLWRYISPVMRHVLLLQLMGLAVFYATIDFPIIAHRYREFFAIFWVFYVAEGLQQIRLVKEISITFVAANVMLYLYLFGNGFFLYGV